MKSYVPIAILWDNTIGGSNTINAGWFRVPLNYVSLSDEDIVLDTSTNKVSVTKGVYEIEAKLSCFNCGGFAIQIRLDDGRSITGTTVHAQSAYHGESITHISRQSIQVTNPTNIALWVYSDKSGIVEHRFPHFPASVQNTLGLRYGAVMSIKKLS